MDLKSIQIRLREIIKDSQYTQRDIAKAIGVSAQTVSKYMKKNVFPALDTLAKLCNLLEVSADYVLGLKEYI
ncbi:MAG: helix-turn-helix transcriptional regulator [Clostridia bacterium]|nr:helix-turn-helix transcriptional regulator [Clostridia bacterium]MDY2714184.1 helix-turn-helix transcriptional regulator [Christensenellaceae bacterium]